MPNVPDHKDIAAAKLLVRELKIASTRRVLLNDIRQVVTLSEEDSDLGRCAKKYVEAQREFVTKSNEVYTAKVAEVSNFVNPLLTKIFKTTIPGVVTLPIEKTGKTASYIITQLEMINVDEKGAIYGIVSVSSLDRVTHTTMNFYVQDNQPYFVDEDIY